MLSAEIGQPGQVVGPEAVDVEERGPAGHPVELGRVRSGPTRPRASRGPGRNGASSPAGDAKTASRQPATIRLCVSTRVE